MLLIGIVLSSVSAAVLSRQYYFNLPITPHLTRDHQYWRLVSHHLAFTNSSELFLGTLLLWFTSLPVERMLGSRKYASFLLAMLLIQTILETLALLLFGKLGLTYLPAGPFGIVFAIA